MQAPYSRQMRVLGCSSVRLVSVFTVPPVKLLLFLVLRFYWEVKIGWHLDANSAEWTYSTYNSKNPSIRPCLEGVAKTQTSQVLELGSGFFPAYEKFSIVSFNRDNTSLAWTLHKEKLQLGLRCLSFLKRKALYFWELLVVWFCFCGKLAFFLHFIEQTSAVAANTCRATRLKNVCLYQLFISKMGVPFRQHKGLFTRWWTKSYPRSTIRSTKTRVPSTNNNK